MYRGTGVSRGVRGTTWERSLKNWELQFPCFEEFFQGGNTLGLVPASHPHTLGYACTFYAPTSPLPKFVFFFCAVFLPPIDAEVLQSGFGVNLLFWSGECY